VSKANNFFVRELQWKKKKEINLEESRKIINEQKEMQLKA
jgi:hypothetical protein